MDAVSFMAFRSVSLAGLAAHLPEIRPAAELEPEHQGAVGDSVHIFTLYGRNKERDFNQTKNINITILADWK